MLGAVGHGRIFTTMKDACNTCPGLDHKLLPEVVHAVYLVIRWPNPNALSHPNCFQSIYAYSKVNVCSCSAADRPSDDVVVEAAGLEQAPGVQGNFYIACCSEQPQGSIGIGIGIYDSKCPFSTYSYGYASQQHNPAHSAQKCSVRCIDGHW